MYQICVILEIAFVAGIAIFRARRMNAFSLTSLVSQGIFFLLVLLSIYYPSFQQLSYSSYAQILGLSLNILLLICFFAAIILGIVGVVRSSQEERNSSWIVFAPLIVGIILFALNWAIALNAGLS
jgi:hypothetical protein